MKEILKAIFKTGSSSIASIIFGMVTTKIIAITTGATGVGLFSQLRQIWQTSTAIATLNGQNALIQGISSKDNKEAYIKTIFILYLLGSIFISIILLLFADILAKILLNSTEGNYIRILSAIVVISTIGMFFSNVLNGYIQIGKIALLQVIASFSMMAVSFPLIKFLGLNALVVILLISQIVICILSSWFIFKLNNFGFFKAKFNIADIRHFLYIAATTFIVGIVATGSLLIIKTIIIQKQGLAAAGIFDAVWTLSTVYVMIILSSFSTYYLPALSSLKNPKEQTLLIHNILRLVIIIIVPVICSVIVLKPLVIQLLYSKEFISAIDIIRWMLIGDFFKVISWVLALPAIAFMNMKVYFWTEMISNLSFLILSAISIIFFNNIEFIGIILLMVYFLNFLYYLYYTKVNHNLRLTKIIIWPWISGLSLIILTSIITWSDKSVNWPLALFLISIAIFLSWLAINKNERLKLIQMLFGKNQIS